MLVGDRRIKEQKSSVEQKWTRVAGLMTDKQQVMDLAISSAVKVWSYRAVIAPDIAL